MTLDIALGFIVGSSVAGALVYLKLKSQLLEKTTELQILSQQKLGSEEIRGQMASQFELLAAKILDDKTAKISDQNMKTLSLVLDPLKERLKDFEKRVEETYSSERAERGTLRGELSKLMELNSKMSLEASNLTKALKGDVKTQGNWGEMILENILERSGLRKGEEYIVQGTDMGLKNDEGQIIRPDIVVNLPDNKQIIVDSKVSLLAYESYAQANSIDEQERSGKQHVDSLKKHIDGLSAKKYYSAEQLITPDFVILFMPMEPAFALAFRLKPDLLQYAWERNIALVSPTTLLTSLRTVSAIWKQENRKRNAEEIAARGGLLYDKFAGLIEDFTEVGRKLEAAEKSHAAVMSKLNGGPGNLITQVEKLKELGAKTSKKLPEIGI
jgi:DNA recombination protein RmuC